MNGRPIQADPEGGLFPPDSTQPNPHSDLQAREQKRSADFHIGALPRSPKQPTPIRRWALRTTGVRTFQAQIDGPLIACPLFYPTQPSSLRSARSVGNQTNPTQTAICCAAIRGFREIRGHNKLVCPHPTPQVEPWMMAALRNLCEMLNCCHDSEGDTSAAAQG